MRRALLALLLLVGCTYARVDVHEPDVTPVSYQPRAGARLERSIGRLRRLALVVAPFEASPADPRWCLDPCDAAVYTRDAQVHALALLEDWRGYEVVTPPAPPALDAASLAALGRSLATDGVLVVRGRMVRLTWLDAAAWVATLTFAIPISLARVGTSGEAEIYESTSGRLVWRSHARGGGDTTPDALVEALLGPLELAWPRALVER